MIEFFSKLFDTSDYPPRWQCGNWSSGEGWLHIISDFATFGAYMAIPCVLVWLLYRRTDVIFPKVFWLFAAFIFSCGSMHAIEAIIFWHPLYRFSGIVKAVTAIVSWACVIATIKFAPTAIRLPSLTRLNADLENQIARQERMTSMAASITDATQNSPADNGPLLAAAAKQFGVEVAAIVTEVDADSGQWHAVRSGIAATQCRDGLPRVNDRLINFRELRESTFQSDELATPLGRIRNVAATALVIDGVVFGALVVGDREHPLDGEEQELLLRLSRLISPTVATRQRLADANSQRLLAEQRLEDTRGELDRLAQINTLGELTAGIAHELNQPLTALINFADAAHTMSKGPLNSETMSELSSLTEKTYEQASRAGDVLRSVRSIVEKTRREISSFDLRQLVDETVDLLRDDINAKNVEVRIESQRERIEMSADATQVQQLLMNLLRNALDAISSTKSSAEDSSDGFDRMNHVICVGLEQTTQRVVISVSDTGQGLETADAERLFDPFFTTRASGLGLGLNICRTIVELHGGQITATNTEKGGAKFTATFPNSTPA